jgi:hypothetical protein
MRQSNHRRPHVGRGRAASLEDLEQLVTA